MRSSPPPSLVESESVECTGGRHPRYPAPMTYSIVARDPETGRFAVAVQSHFIGVGPVVPWLEAGVGAVATQASVNTAFGPIGLELLRAGSNAEQTVSALLASDENPQVR